MSVTLDVDLSAFCYLCGRGRDDQFHAPQYHEFKPASSGVIDEIRQLVADPETLLGDLHAVGRCWMPIVLAYIDALERRARPLPDDSHRDAPDCNCIACAIERGRDDG